MQPLLLATDGSPCTAEATREAIALARELGVSITVVSVAPETTSTVGYGYESVKLTAELRRSRKSSVANYLSLYQPGNHDPHTPAITSRRKATWGTVTAVE